MPDARKIDGIWIFLQSFTIFKLIDTFEAGTREFWTKERKIVREFWTKFSHNLSSNEFFFLACTNSEGKIFLGSIRKNSTETVTRRPLPKRFSFFFVVPHFGLPSWPKFYETAWYLGGKRPGHPRDTLKHPETLWNTLMKHL